MKTFLSDLFQALIFAALMFAPFFIYFWKM
jgi:hypothetical protein